MTRVDQRDIFSIDEMDGIIERAETLEAKALFSILFITGARINEILDLTLENVELSVDRTHLLISVYTSKTHTHERVKVRRTNFVPLSYPEDDPVGVFKSKLVNTLMSYLEGFTEKKQKLWVRNRSTYWRWLKKIVPNGWLHLFRHTRATMFGRAGGSSFQLKQWFGWSADQTVSRYVRLNDDMSKQLSKLL